MYALSDYDYELPEALIAQTPSERRDASKLLVLDRNSGTRSHAVFRDLPDLLNPSDVLVINNTEVIPGRLFGKKETGGRVELLILNYADISAETPNNESITCQCLIRASKRPRPGTTLIFDAGLTGEVVQTDDRTVTVRFVCEGNFEQILYKIGKTPLPPYIRRGGEDGETAVDRRSYQTVYASRKGAVAAPTAGLHFTDALLDRLVSKGIRIAPITLHVGYGTFLPVRADDIRSHTMNGERFELPKASADTINAAKAEGARIVAVGSTSVRSLEFAADDVGRVAKQNGWCDLYIYPGYRFKLVDAMITNFHLPRSTLLMLVSALAGRNAILDAYREAMEAGYRFYSYGDAMLIL